ncbi:MAG: tRNA epoxyqueuosine(34) reductase QueG, partial [Duncaniella sp.]|nr:tRNA epoxyqueuosine(34) reductase QueG [Duncaniella sp.]
MMDAAEVKALLAKAGATACGIARIEPVDLAEEELYARWLAAGRHGEMSYLEKYAEIRRDPELLLPGARSIVVAAFNYYHANNG